MKYMNKILKGLLEALNFFRHKKKINIKYKRILANIPDVSFFKKHDKLFPILLVFIHICDKVILILILKQEFLKKKLK